VEEKFLPKNLEVEAMGKGYYSFLLDQDIVHLEHVQLKVFYRYSAVGKFDQVEA
jgi:hypothetical protein